MRRILVVLGIAVLSSGITLSGQTVNKENTTVSFEIRSMKVNKVGGSFAGIEGEVQFDPSDPGSSNFKVCIDASTVNTVNEKRDEHLRNEDFFHVEVYPSICFKSEEVSELEDGFVAKGTLSMTGVSRDVEIPFAYENGVLTGSLSVNRYDYNLAKDEGEFKASAEVIIHIVSEVNH